jgi:hypothetical protein
VGDDEQGIGGIEAESHDVEFRHAETIVDGRADPQVRGRRPRRPARVLQDADVVVPAADRGRPARTGGSAPPMPPKLTV